MLLQTERVKPGETRGNVGSQKENSKIKTVAAHASL